eukprot:PLAT12454.1.p1 GENE.PLAT12454.1~~PLAT12454.1.p1  ORF type:complete len:511 (-),score=280.29 PLAT12454.1:68-1600(-)
MGQGKSKGKGAGGKDAGGKASAKKRVKGKGRAKKRVKGKGKLKVKDPAAGPRTAAGSKAGGRSGKAGVDVDALVMRAEAAERAAAEEAELTIEIAESLSDGSGLAAPEEPASSPAEPAKKVSIEDFDLLKVLGRGSFGKVMLVRRKGGPAGELLALKSLRKSDVLKRNQLEHTAAERKILQTVEHPSIVALKYAWQTSGKLYLVLEFMSGGELFYWLKRHKRFSEDRARLYAAEILLALEKLHSLDCIYRDLKPENCLLNADGHVKLTDFGLSKEGVSGVGAEDGTKTFCGTPEYLAPEILRQTGHGKAVDWWSLGTLLYEMLCGLPPFYDGNVQRMYQKILKAELQFPSHVSADARSLLRGLLTRNVDDRLGSGPRDGEEIREHPFFAALDWDRVLAHDYEPEFKPPLSDDLNFEGDFTKMVAVDSVIEGRLTDEQLEKTRFVGFTYDGDSTLDLVDGDLRDDDDDDDGVAAAAAARTRAAGVVDEAAGGGGEGGVVVVEEEDEGEDDE